MSYQTTMITGDGIVTTIDRNFVPQFVLIGAVDTDNPVKKIEVSIGGTPFVSLTGQSIVQSFSKLEMQGLLGADVKIGQVFRLANGFIPNQTLQIRLTNSGAFTPDVFFNSGNKGNRPVFAGQETIQSNDTRMFQGKGFSHLIFDATNLDYAIIDFVDGHNDKLEPVELAARFATYKGSDADGLLAGNTVIQNFGDIASVSLWTTGGNLSVTKVML